VEWKVQLQVNMRFCSRCDVNVGDRGNKCDFSSRKSHWSDVKSGNLTSSGSAHSAGDGGLQAATRILKNPDVIQFLQLVEFW
jgi:hypothetical protein